MYFNTIVKRRVRKKSEKVWSFAKPPSDLVRFPDPLRKWVGRTNPPRAGNLTSEASSTKMLLAPPNVSYIIGFCTMWRRPGHRKNLWQSFMVVARADLVAPPVCPLAPHQFVQKDFCQFSTWICDQESFRISLHTISDLSRQYCCI